MAVQNDLTEHQIAVLSKDRILAEILHKHNLAGFDIQQSLYHELTAAIVYQQISIKAAAAVYGRFVDLVGWEYRPSNVLMETISSLRAVGLSIQKATYILAIAEYFEEKPHMEHRLMDEPDQVVIRELTSIKGVGTWTAKMVLMFYMQRLDVFPWEDLGVVTAMEKLYDLPEDKKLRKTKMLEIAEQWAPYKSIGSMYMWAWKRAN
jgi:DNA-3-methyladenine glycosylase II